ncbi:MAG: hypothetical protein ABJA79_02400 [Parafilimonas sp.]
MTQVQKKREKLINAINTLSEDKLQYVEELIREITMNDKQSLQFIYNKAVRKYHDTLQKLAQ